MSGLDDLIGSLQKAQTGGHSGGGGLEDILGSVLGGSGSSGGGGGLGDILGSVLGGGSGQSGGGGGGLGDILGNVLGGGAGGTSTRSGASGGNLMATLGPILAALLANGGLQKILGSLRTNGLSAEADSWVSTGDNKPIDPAQVTQALGGEVSQVAGQLGIDEGQASELLAHVLPGLVNTVTPDGSEPSNADLDKLADVLKGFS